MTNPQNLSIIIPAYNEAKRISETLDELAKFIKKQHYSGIEVIAVVARGKDKTLEIAQFMAHVSAGKYIIIGVRDLKSSHTGLRKFISSFGNFLIRLLLRLDIKDTQC